jgi:protoporphyrinogen/coproporphyrinogen III oxidase
MAPPAPASAFDAVVVGAGVSGTIFAHQAARAGRRVLLVEREDRVGGCLHTVRTPQGFWFELGAHTCYNSYRALLEVLEGAGLMGALQRRGKPRLRFLDGDALVPGANLWALLRLLDKRELLTSLRHAFGARQAGETVYSFYARLVGRGNYGRVLGPMLSAVPSQPADAFPADMLFKKRPRRKDVMRSFTLQSGLAAIPETLVRHPGVEVRLGAAATAVERRGAGYAVTLAGGEQVEAPVLCLATPPAAAAALLAGSAPEVASLAARVREAAVDTLGFAVRAARVARLPPSTFLIPLEDVFHSVVTRDPVPDPDWRGFAIHFRPGLTPAARRERACAVLGLQPGDLEAVAERRTVLPSPVLGHQDLVREVDRLLGGGRLALTGNWFGGLAIEDCALRSREEWARVSA